MHLENLDVYGIIIGWLVAFMYDMHMLIYLEIVKIRSLLLNKIVRFQQFLLVHFLFGIRT